MSIYPVKSHIMRIRSQSDATMLIYKHFAVFLKTIHTKEVHHHNVCKEENGDVRRGAQISYSSLISIRIDAYRHVLSIEINRTLQECFKSTILGIVDLATVARIIHYVGGHSIRIAE